MNKNKGAEDLSSKSLQIISNEFELSSKQIDIYNSLKDIGEEISTFYLEGLKIIKGDSKIKPYLLAHVAREIDGGIRYLFIDKEDKDKVFLSEEEIEFLKNDINQELRQKNVSEIEKINGTVISICNFLHLSKDKYLVKEWVVVSSQFAKYAHRHGPQKNLREENVFLDVWERYENVLARLIGGYIRVLDRVDQVLVYKNPSKQILEALPNLLESEARRRYLFTNLEAEEWLVYLKKLEFFNPRNNPRPKEDPDNPGYFSIPDWPVLIYINKLVDKEIVIESQKLICEIIHSIIDFTDENGQRIDNYITDGKIVEIMSKLPLKFMDDIFFTFLEKALNSKWGSDFISAEIEKYLAPRLVDEKSKEHLIKFIDVILKYKRSERGFKEYSSVMAEYWLNELFEKYSKRIVSICGDDLLAVVENKIKTIKSEENNSFSYVSIPNIGGRIDGRSTENFTNQLVYLLRDILFAASTGVTESTIKEYLNGDGIFKRIAIYIIGQKFDEFGHLIFDIDYNPIDNHHLKHELFELFKGNCKKISGDNLEKVIQWIDNQEIIIPDNKKGDTEAIKLSTAYRKKEWLFALLESDDGKIKKLYEEQDKINSGELDHPGLNFWSESGWVEEKSPIRTDQLLQLDNSEISKQLKIFKGGTHFEGPTEQGLANTLEATIIENLQKFTENLDPFLDLQLVYISSIIKAFQEAWKSKNNFDWESLLFFIEKIVSSDSFWENVYKKGEYDYKNWILSSIADLIESGTQSDDNAFNIDLLPKAIEILLLISNKSESDLENMNQDIVTSVLNSTKGKVYKAMVDCSLRNARANLNEDDPKKWIKEIKDHFSHILDNVSEQNVEFFTVLGEYLKNIYYLDQEWVAKNIDKIFSQDNNLYWESVFTGYLYYSLNKNLTPIVVESGNYNKAIEYNLKGEYTNRYLVQHICLLYLESLQDLGDEDSLISKLLNAKQNNRLSELIWFFWSRRDNPPENLKEKIKPIWGYLINLLKNYDDSESKKLLVSLSEWLSLVDKIDDDILEWLKISARSFDKEYKASTFIEYLNIHVDKTPDKVGDIFKELLNSGIFPRFREEDVISIVETLYSKGFKELADFICNKYAENSVYFLRDIYNSHQ